MEPLARYRLREDSLKALSAAVAPHSAARRLEAAGRETTAEIRLPAD
jgi:ribose 1,5-bisphosphokinase PhnN